MKWLAALFVIALAVPAGAATITNKDCFLFDGNGRIFSPTDYTLSMECFRDPTIHYSTHTGVPPDTLGWDKHALVWGPVKEPVNLKVEWITEANVNYGFVQFKELDYSATGGTPTYTWGAVHRQWVGATPGANTTKAEFQVGLWDSVRVWLDGSSDGIAIAHISMNVIE